MFLRGHSYINMQPFLVCKKAWFVAFSFQTAQGISKVEEELRELEGQVKKITKYSHVRDYEGCERL